MHIRFCAFLLLTALAASAERASIPLAGTWSVQLDEAAAGHSRNWHALKIAGDPIFLPGSLDQAGLGRKTKGPEKGWLSRPVTYEGQAWYQREITIPATWREKRITLFLERPHWKTQVWVDGRPAGERDSLSVPHVYELSGLEPGRHLLTICVDNTYRIDVGRDAHSVTEHTQTNWNGVVGRIELQATDPVWIDNVAIFPDPANRTVRLAAYVRNATGRSVTAEIAASAAGVAIAKSASIAPSGAAQKFEIVVALPKTTPFWDEYTPSLHSVEVTLKADRGFQDCFGARFGLRQIATRGTQFTLNGRPIFLRGTLECSIFPKTGYPPADVESWARLFRIARAHGLNHFRFHSYCPPEAAFVAADEAGFLLQVELPVWSQKVGVDPALNAFMRKEAQRIADAYGNHPSFTMLCLGNELAGSYEFMDQLVADLKKADQRRLYTFSTDYQRRVPGPTSDYYVANRTVSGRLRINGARFGKTMSGTDFDFAVNVRQTPIPLVAHELGSWVVFPSFEEIASYTGVLKPRNLEAFRNQLEARGMADQARDFQAASGRFAWLLYKEDMETTLRTPGFGGYQLLQLQDFPGQGEALVGILDSFWNSKGILTPDEFRQFSSETVPLMRTTKFVWTSDETLTADVHVAHYGKQALTKRVAMWAIRGGDGETWASGKMGPFTLHPGSVRSVGKFAVPLARIEKAARIKVTVSIEGTGSRNNWDLWVYPKNLEPALPRNTIVTRDLKDRDWEALENGATVALLSRADATAAQSIPFRFLPVFWSFTWFQQPGTLGILCDPAHPALAGFPTDMHSNWQWWELTEGARAFVLDDTPGELRPIVQVIDDYHRNHKLGAVFEARVGRGRLLVSSLDLDSDREQRPVARQLRHSLLRYVESERFQPKVTLDRRQLQRILGGF